MGNFAPHRVISCQGCSSLLAFPRLARPVLAKRVARLVHGEVLKALRCSAFRIPPCVRNFLIPSLCMGILHTLWPAFAGCPFIPIRAALLFEELLWGVRRPAS